MIRKSAEQRLEMPEGKILQTQKAEMCTKTSTVLLVSMGDGLQDLCGSPNPQMLKALM